MIYSNRGDLNIWHDTYYGNHASTHGGAIYVFDCDVTLTNTLIISKTASAGGGIYDNQANLTLSHNDFFGNAPSHIDDGSGALDPTTLGSSNRVTNPQSSSRATTP